jgi:uncharacterized membrane protein
MLQKVAVIKFTMRNVCYWMMLILCVVGAITFLYKVLLDIESITSWMSIGVPANIAIYCGILAIMCEYRPRTTPQQIKRDQEIIDNGFMNITLVTIANAILLVMSMVMNSGNHM